MKRRTGIATYAALFACVAGCATQAYDPFRISRSDIYEKVTTLAMMPLESPDFDRKEEVGARYEALITERLHAAGFKVIPSKESSTILNSGIEELGGIFDPKTGQVAEDKRQAVNEQLVQEMRAKFGVDAYVTPRIDTVAADWTGNSAYWDGATAPTTGSAGFWAGFKNSNMSGTIPALSLIVVVNDQTNSERYYVGRGGIQLSATFGETFAAGFKSVPKSAWFVDKERDVTAVNLALSKLVSEQEPAK